MPIKDDTGAIIGNITIITDMTEMKEKEKEIEELLEYTNSCLKNLGEATGTLDKSISSLQDEVMRIRMVKMGARKSRITAKFAGGAQVFKHMSLDILKIGDRNAMSVEYALIKKNIPILAKDIGGNVGRNVF